MIFVLPDRVDAQVDLTEPAGTIAERVRAGSACRGH